MTRKKTGGAQREQARGAMAKGRTIGAQVYWQALQGLRVSRALFRQAVDAAGFKAALAAPPGADKVLYTAANRANQRVEGDVKTKTKTHYAELKDKAAAGAVYAIMARRDVGGVRTYVEEGTLSIALPADAPPAVVQWRANIPPDPTRDALVDGIVDTYQDLLTYAYSQEVSETLVRAMVSQCSALTLKGGLYLVTAEHLPAVRDLEKQMLDACGVQLDVWVIGDQDDNRQVAGRNASGELRASYEALLADVEQFTAAHAGEPEDVPMRSVACKLRDFKQLDGKVALYADVLGDYADNLRSAIAAARATMLKAMGLNDATDAAVEEAA